LQFYITAMGKKFIAIKNQADSNTLELYFLDVIQDSYDFWSDSTYSKVQEIIDKVNFYQPKTIRCIMDSIGGDVYVGLAVYNFLKSTSAKVEVEVIGLCCSIASVIAMAANKGKLSIAKNAFMMLHKAQGDTCGSADELRQAADLVEKCDDQIADIYSQRSGKTVEEIKALYANGDYWMTGDEAVAQGFADSVFNDNAAVQVAARLDDLKICNNLPDSIKALLPEANQESGSITTLIQNQFSDMKKFFTDIVNNLKGLKVEATADNTTIVNQVANTISAPLEKLGDELETQITNQVDTAIKAEGFTTVINAAIKTEVENQVKPLNEKITNLEAANKTLGEKNTELETEIANLKGGTGTGGGNAGKDAPKVIGSFKK
jgi:ATP-dependent Clp endopeptidase proteolytic subunit ClpP